MNESRSDLEKFWEVIESKFGCNVPIYVQNVLALNGYDNALSISTVTSGDIEYMQNYARDEMHKRIPKNSDLKNYYGYFWETPKEFQFLRGHIKLLEKIVELINTTTASKGPDVFSFKSKSKTQPNKVTVRQDLLGTIGLIHTS